VRMPTIAFALSRSLTHTLSLSHFLSPTSLTSADSRELEAARVRVRAQASYSRSKPNQGYRLESRRAVNMQSVVHFVGTPSAGGELGGR